MKWFLGDVKGAIFYYRRYKNLSAFVKKLEEGYLSYEKRMEQIPTKEDLIVLSEKKGEYEIAKKILKGKYNG